MGDTQRIGKGTEVSVIDDVAQLKKLVKRFPDDLAWGDEYLPTVGRKGVVVDVEDGLPTVRMDTGDEMTFPPEALKPLGRESAEAKVEKGVEVSVIDDVSKLKELVESFSEDLAWGDEYLSTLGKKGVVVDVEDGVATVKMTTTGEEMGFPAKALRPAKQSPAQVTAGATVTVVAGKTILRDLVEKYSDDLAWDAGTYEPCCGREGKVVEVDGDIVDVDFGDMQCSLPIGSLRVAGKNAGPPSAVRTSDVTPIIKETPKLVAGMRVRIIGNLSELRRLVDALKDDLSWEEDYAMACGKAGTVEIVDPPTVDVRLDESTDILSFPITAVTVASSSPSSPKPARTIKVLTPRPTGGLAEGSAVMVQPVPAMLKAAFRDEPWEDKYLAFCGKRGVLIRVQGDRALVEFKEGEKADLQRFPVGALCPCQSPRHVKVTGDIATLTSSYTKAGLPAPHSPESILNCEGVILSSSKTSTGAEVLEVQFQSSKAPVQVPALALLVKGPPVVKSMVKKPVPPGKPKGPTTAKSAPDPKDRDKPSQKSSHHCCCMQ